MNSRTVLFLLILAAIVVVLASAGLFQARVQSREMRVNELAPIAALLKDDQEVQRALQTDSVQGKESGMLGSYLAVIRADGVAKHADKKVKLDRLAENNAGILALINVYSPHAKTAFSAEALGVVGAVISNL